MIARHWNWVVAGCSAWALSGCGADEPLDDATKTITGGGAQSAEKNDASAGGASGGANDGGIGGDRGAAGASALDGGVENGGMASNMSSPENALVGEHCGPNMPCSAGLECLLESNALFGEGTLAGGFCTSKCENSDQCEALDQGSGCLVFSNGTMDDETDDVGYCMDACTPGSAPSAQNPKCDLRTDRYCEPLGELGGACLPRCYGHDSCPGGFCDGWTGACVTERRPGKDLGETCATAEECNGGICYFSAPDSGTGVCTESCIFAPLAGACGQPGAGDAPPEFLCVPDIGTILARSAFDSLDLGLCVGTCDEDTDCKHEGFFCRPFTAEGSLAIGKQGYCLQTFALEEEPSGGGAGGTMAGGAGGTMAGGAGGTTAGGAGGTTAGASGGMMAGGGSN